MATVVHGQRLQETFPSRLEFPKRAQWFSPALFPFHRVGLQGGVGTTSYVQENGRRVDGWVSVGGYSVTVTLKDPDGTVKASQTTWPNAELRYQVDLTATIAASDTVEVTTGGSTTNIFVDPLTAQIDTEADHVTGSGPAGETLAVELYVFDESMGMYETYTATVSADTTGQFTATDFYREGLLTAVDIEAEDYGVLRYEHADSNQIYLNFGQIIYVHQNHNHVSGYTSLPGVPVSVTLQASDGSVKAKGTNWSWEFNGRGTYEVNLYSSEPDGDPVPIRGGDEVIVTIAGVSTTVPVDLLTAAPDLGTDTIAGSGPPSSTLEVTLNNCYDEMSSEQCREWVTTDAAGNYTAGPFLYSTWGMTDTVTHTYDIQAGDTGQVHYTNPDNNIIYINYAASQARVQENGRRVDGWVSVGGYSVTVTLKDPDGTVKASQTTWPNAELRYQVDLTATIAASDTVEVTTGGSTTNIFVDPLTAQIDTEADHVTGSGPAGETLAVELYVFDESMGMYETYTATVSADTTGQFTATDFYREGLLTAVDIEAEDYGVLRYEHADSNQIYLNFGQIIYVHQNHNHVSGYTSLPGVPVSVTLQASDGSVKAKGTNWSWEFNGRGTYEVNLYSSEPDGDPVPIRGGDEVIVTIAGVSTTVPVDLLTAAPDLGTDTIAGSGPPSSTLEVTLNNCYDEMSSEQCREWVTTDAAGNYTAGPFLYSTWGTTVTHTYDIQAGDTGQVHYTNPDNNIIYINYAATGVATTIAAGDLRAGATAVLGTAVPNATIEIWDVTENQLIGTGTASADARFAITVDPPLVYGHTIVAIADGLASIGHVVQAAVTINGPSVTVSDTVGFYGIAPANSTVVVYEQGATTGLVTTTADAGGHWATIATLSSQGTYTLTAKAVEPNQTSAPITVIYDPQAVSVSGSSGSVGGETHESDASGQNHFQVIGGVQPVTITVEVLNNPCTVTISFMGRTVTPTAGTTPTQQITYTAVFTDYEWDWGTHDVIVNAISCGGTPVSQKVSEITLIDPSGYVYNADTGERIQGATVTCHYSKTTQNKWVVWEAALYNNQLNPQSTNKEGRYGFMVPAGAYYVTASKPGYADNQTIVYQIPPPVTDAHIALTPLAGKATTVTLDADVNNLPVGGATTTLTATLIDTYGDPVDDGTTVTFTTDLGTWQSTGTSTLPTTTANGVATATLVSSETAGSATLIATTDTVSDTTTVTFTPGAAATVALEAASDQIMVGGATTTLTATLQDQYGNAVTDGTIVTFTTNLGTWQSTGTAIRPTTTADGAVTATVVSSNTAGLATLVAATNTVSDTTVVTFTSGTVDRFVFAAIGNQTTHTPFNLTLTAYDTYDNVVTSFTDTVALMDTTGTLSPTMTGNFASGKWSGVVEIDAAAPSVVITATHGDVASASDPFTVTETLQPPTTPTLLAPSDGHITTTQAITLTWQMGTGPAPDGYHVDLDGNMITTTNTFSPTLLATDIHTWTVRAYNTSGVSEWAPVWSLEITQHNVYLPLVTRNHPGTE